MFVNRPSSALLSLQRTRIIILRLGLIALIFIIWIKVFFLQVIKGAEFGRVSEGNRVQVLFETAPRGIIFDREDRIIVSNRCGFDLLYSPLNMTKEQIDRTLDYISARLDIAKTPLLKRVEKEIIHSYGFLTIARNIPRELVGLFSEQKFTMPGLEVKIEPFRDYRYGSTLAHVIGYLGEINKKELELLSLKGYKMGDRIGKVGLEKVYDRWLRGIAGGKEIEMDARGRRIRVLNSYDSKWGYNLRLSIDLELQKKGEALLDGKKGSIVAIDPSSGEILTLISKPDFDPNLFVYRIKEKDWEDLMLNSDVPLLNRAIQGRYPPASVFKIITAISGLEKGVITTDTQMTCNSEFVLGDTVFHCWEERGHGKIGILEAISQSCDLFFYKTGLEVGPDLIVKHSHAFGFGYETGIDIGIEDKGLVPQIGKYWRKGDTVNLSIGQGDLLVTPIQMALFASVLANKGTLYYPYIVKDISDQEGRKIKEFQPRIKRKIDLNEKTWQIIREGMSLAVEKGTAVTARLRDVKIAGKTGTAENPHGEDHAWFICFSPIENPEIAIAVLVENGGFGATAAAPLAREMIRQYYKKK